MGLSKWRKRISWLALKPLVASAVFATSMPGLQTPTRPRGLNEAPGLLEGTLAGFGHGPIRTVAHHDLEGRIAHGVVRVARIRARRKSDYIDRRGIGPAPLPVQQSMPAVEPIPQPPPPPPQDPEMIEALRESGLDAVARQMGAALSVRQIAPVQAPPAPPRTCQ